MQGSLEGTMLSGATPACLFFLAVSQNLCGVHLEIPLWPAPITATFSSLTDQSPNQVNYCFMHIFGLE